MSTCDVVLVMFEHFIGTAEGSSELGGQESFLGATDVEEDEVTRLVDVLCSRVSGGDSLELNGMSTFLSCGREWRLSMSNLTYSSWHVNLSVVLGRFM